MAVNVNWDSSLQENYHHMLPRDNERPEGCANDVLVELYQLKNKR